MVRLGGGDVVEHFLRYLDSVEFSGAGEMWMLAMALVYIRGGNPHLSRC